MHPKHSLEVMSSSINLGLEEERDSQQRKRRRTLSGEGSKSGEGTKRRHTATHQDMELSDGEDDQDGIQIIEPSPPDNEV